MDNNIFLGVIHTLLNSLKLALDCNQISLKNKFSFQDIIRNAQTLNKLLDTFIYTCYNCLSLVPVGM